MELIIEHIKLANKIARRVKKKCGRFATYEELQSVAYESLVDTAKNYKPEVGPFDRYAAIRINGSLNDYLKWLGRGHISSDMLKVTRAVNIPRITLEELFSELVFGLPTKYKKILRWFYIDNFSAVEISKMSGLNLSTVYFLLSKCREQIRINHKHRRMELAAMVARRQYTVAEEDTH